MRVGPPDTFPATTSLSDSAPWNLASRVITPPPMKSPDRDRSSALPSAKLTIPPAVKSRTPEKLPHRSAEAPLRTMTASNSISPSTAAEAPDSTLRTSSPEPPISVPLKLPPARWRFPEPRPRLTSPMSLAPSLTVTVAEPSLIEIAVWSGSPTSAPLSSTTRTTPSLTDSTFTAAPAGPVTLPDSATRTVPDPVCLANIPEFAPATVPVALTEMAPPAVSARIASRPPATCVAEMVTAPPVALPKMPCPVSPVTGPVTGSEIAPLGLSAWIPPTFPKMVPPSAS